MPRKNIKVTIEIDAPRDEASPLVTQIAGHLDSYYRELGGEGFRVGDYVDDDAQGVQVLSKIGSDEYQITIRLFPRSRTDDSVLLDLTQDYVGSSEFRAWLDGLEDENLDSK